MRRSLAPLFLSCGLLWSGCSSDSPASQGTETPTRDEDTTSASPAATGTAASATTGIAAPLASAVSAAAASTGSSSAVASIEPSASGAAIASASAAKPMSSAGRISDARAAQIRKELASLDVSLLSALNSSGTSTGVLNDSQVNRRGLDDAAASGRGSGVGGLNIGGGGGGTLRPGTGGSGGLAGIGTTSPAGSEEPTATIAGKAVKVATASDVQSALESAGCKATRLDSPSSPPSKIAKFGVKCDEKSFVLTFIERGGDLPSSTALSELEKSEAVFKRDGVLVSVKPGTGADFAAARILLEKVVRTGAALSPKGNAAIGGASVSGGTVSNAGAVVAGMAAGFRRCYSRGLKENPESKGSMKVTAHIDSTGAVTSATPSGGNGLSREVQQCVAGVVASRVFAAPEGGAATIGIPVTFVPQQ